MKRYLLRILLGIAFTTVMLAHIAGVIEIPFLAQFERIAYDTRVRWTMESIEDPRIVIVDIDERSLSVEGQWPWSRDKLARLVDQLGGLYQVELIAFDSVFPEPEESHDLVQLKALASQAGDEALARAVAPYEPALDRDRLFAQAIGRNRVVLGYFFHTGAEQAVRAGVLPPPLFGAGDLPPQTVFPPPASGYTGNLPQLQEQAVGGGFFSNPLVDADGIYRRVPLLHEYDGAIYESLALAVARHYLGLEVIPGFAGGPGAGAGYPQLEYLEVGPFVTPVDQRTAVLIPFSGRRGTFRYVSATDVLNGTVEEPEFLAGTIALIGTTAAGLVDLRPTPVENVFPGVEIHANIIAGILDESIKWRPAYTIGAEFVAVALLGITGAVLLPFLNPVVASAVTWLLIGADIGFNVYLWEHQQHVLPLANSLVLILGLYILSMFYGFFFEARTRSHLRSLFGQYVPPELVEEMSRNPGHYTLASEKREMTVLFTDIRGFTSISEGLDPAELSHLMNEFLTPMTRIVHKHRGTIDKYMGDAMMAFWGAPVDDSDHAAHAVEAALEMRRTLAGLQPEFHGRGWPEVRIGIGINTGPMNVGNMGSEFRMAYTVLGDAVNLGSRLEGLTKTYGVGIIVGETTAAAAPGFLYRELDRVRVRGKDQPVVVFEPLGPTDEVDAESSALAARWQESLGAYRGRHWDRCEAVLRELERQPGYRDLAAIYLARVADFRRTPPADDWDGVYTHERK